MEFIISISRPGKSWNLSRGHGKSKKVMEKQYAFGKQNGKKKKKMKKLTDESATAFNFSRNRSKHALYAL